MNLLFLWSEPLPALALGLADASLHLDSCPLVPTKVICGRQISRLEPLDDADVKTSMSHCGSFILIRFVDP